MGGNAVNGYGYRKRKQKDEMTFTKRKVSFLLFVGVLGAFIPYLLSAFGRDPVQAIGMAWITEIVAVILGYYLKSYNETKEEKRQKLAEFKAGMEDSDE